MTSGVVALLLSAKPGVTPAQLRDALIDGADRSEWSPDTGHGIIHAARSMTALN